MVKHPQRTARLALILALAVSAGLYLTPPGRYLGYPLLLIATFVHELGHGLAALLVGADFHSLVMHIDGAGAAQIGGQPGRLASATIAFGGLLGPAVAAAVLFPLVVRPWLARVGLAVAGTGSLLAGILVVRNVTGWLLVAVVALVCLSVALRAPALLAQTVLALVAVQLGLSVFARADYLFSRVAETPEGALPSDVAVVSQALYLPYWLWGMLAVVVSVGVLAWGVRTFWRATRARPATGPRPGAAGSAGGPPAHPSNNRRPSTAQGRARSA